MNDNNDRIVGLLEEMLRLQTESAARQQQMLELSRENAAQARVRADASIELQRVAVARQQRFLRIWLGVLVPVAIVIVILFYFLARLMPHMRY